jgi:hypothetical protein
MTRRKMNKISVIYITILFIVFANIVSAGIVSAGGIDKIYISNASGDTGNEILLSVDAVDMNDLGSLQLYIHFNKNVLVAENVTAGNATSGGMFTSNIKDTGITIGIISATGISGSGSIADIIFNVTGPNGISSPLTISMMPPTDSKNGPIIVQSVDNATFTVGNIGIVGTVSPTVGIYPITTRTVPNTDNDSGGDNGSRIPSGKGSSSGDLSNVGTSGGKTSIKAVTNTNEYTVQTATVPEETVVAEETTKPQKMVQPNSTQKSPWLGIIASITILSLIYVFERKKRHKKNRNR